MGGFGLSSEAYSFAWSAIMRNVNSLMLWPERPKEFIVCIYSLVFVGNSIFCPLSKFLPNISTKSYLPNLFNKTLLTIFPQQCNVYNYQNRSIIPSKFSKFVPSFTSHQFNDEFAQFEYFQYFLLLQNLSPYAWLNGSIFFTRSTCLLSPKLDSKYLWYETLLTCR